MKTNYIRQAWVSMRQQPVVSSVSVIGTALAIFLIMIVVMMQEIKTAPYSPESNRDRWLVQRYGSIKTRLGVKTIHQTDLLPTTPSKPYSMKWKHLKP